MGTIRSVPSYAPVRVAPQRSRTRVGFWRLPACKTTSYLFIPRCLMNKELLDSSLVVLIIRYKYEWPSELVLKVPRQGHGFDPSPCPGKLPVADHCHFSQRPGPVEWYLVKACPTSFSDGRIISRLLYGADHDLRSSHPITRQCMHHQRRYCRQNSLAHRTGYVSCTTIHPKIRDCRTDDQGFLGWLLGSPAHALT